jgi:alkanesulfonate monooxygenase SsuD/methylene tetrahydromethanopterin reductase-like flavin-dependent oxidoreductase (luciferase family)
VEHLLYRWADRPARGPWEAWTLLAAIAASTSRIELGPLVACTNFHNPALLAKQAATLDEISGGRLILGLGAGWNETEFRAFGFPFDHRIDRFEEAFTIIRTFSGWCHRLRRRFYGPRLRVATTWPRVAGPPPMIGLGRGCCASRSRAVVERVVLRHGNQPACSQATIVDAARRGFGRDPAAIERPWRSGPTPSGKGRVGAYVQPGGSRRWKRSAEGRHARALRSRGRQPRQVVMDPITIESIHAPGARGTRPQRMASVGRRRRRR